jgi:hypothetical protein
LSARPVRIPRATARAVRTSTSVAPGARFIENRAGWIRARRLFEIFTVLLVVLYGGFLAEALLASPGLVSDPLALVLLTFAAALCGVAGASVTLARAPRGVWWTGDELVVRERFLSPRHYPTNVPWHVARRYPAGILSPEPTEIVEVVPAAGRRMTYLVDEGLLTEKPA